jgi:hypothetical protein
MAETVTAVGSIITTRADVSTGKDLLKDGIIRKLFDDTTGKIEVFYKALVNEKTTKDEWNKDQRMAGLEEAAEMVEGENIPIFGPTIGGTKTYTQRQWGAGIRMTHRMQKFNKIDLWQKMVKQLARIQSYSKDVEVHVMFNSPTSTTLTCGKGFDDLALASTAHTGLLAGTAEQFSNYINAALSVAAVESMRYYFTTKLSDMGQYMGLKLDTVVYNPTLHPTARKIFASDYIPFEESNTINVIPEWKIKLVEDPLVTSPTMWFGLNKSSDLYDINVETSMEPDLVIGDAPDFTRDRVATSFQYFTYGFGYAGCYALGKL